MISDIGLHVPPQRDFLEERTTDSPEIKEMQAKQVSLIPAHDFKGKPRVPPGNRGILATLWNTALVWFKGGEFASYAIQQLPSDVNRKITMINTLFRTVIIITHPDYMKPFLEIRRFGDHLLSGGRPWKIMAEELGDHNFLTSSPDIHKKLREALDPYFSFKAIEQCVPNFLQQSFERVQKWQIQNQPINIRTEMADFAAEAVIKILFQGKTNIKPAKALDDFTQEIGYKIMHIPEFLLNQKKLQQSRDTINQLIDAILDEKNEERSSSSLINALKKEAGSEVEYVRESLKFFLFAGVETTSSLLCSCLYFLSQSMALQEDLLTEMNNNGIQNFENLNAQTLSKLSKLREFVNKVLREHPPIWGQTRRAEEELVLHDKNQDIAFSIPKDSAVILLHAPIEGSSTSTKCPLNFGLGVNECLGNFFARCEVRTFLATLILNSKIKAHPQQVSWAWLSTHHLDGDFFIECEPR